MRPLILFLAIMGLSSISSAQTAEDSVKNVINKLFEGMKAGNGQMIKETFTDSAILQTIGNGEAGIKIENESLNDFVKQVSKLPKGSADERVTYDVIKIDGPLALVWAPYKFYFNGIFSHCGVDSFQLVKIKGEWKIQYLVDTRRKKGCE